jgi:hypothetical protein
VAAGADRLSALGAGPVRVADALGAAFIAVAATASAAGAQTYVGKNIEGGLHWAVAAPQGASWSLVCRFPPVTYFESSYNQEAWINRFERQGAGPQNGRLPLNTGHCHLTKTGGNGPVGIALSRPGRVVSDGVREAGGTAAVGIM